MSNELNPSSATSAVPQDKTAFMKDFSASLVVFLVALPLCMGVGDAGSGGVGDGHYRWLGCGLYCRVSTAGEWTRGGPRGDRV
jgi:hypothetical protein